MYGLRIRSQAMAETFDCWELGYENWLSGHECHLSGREGAGAKVSGGNGNKISRLLFTIPIHFRVRRGKSRWEDTHEPRLSATVFSWENERVLTVWLCVVERKAPTLYKTAVWSTLMECLHNVVLSWLTWVSSVVWRSSTVPVDKLICWLSAWNSLLSTIPVVKNGR